MTFSFVVLIGQTDHVTYGAMMGSGATLLHALLVRRAVVKNVSWVSTSIEINGRHIGLCLWAAL